jgi:hypothetical protein
MDGADIHRLRLSYSFRLCKLLFSLIGTAASKAASLILFYQAHRSGERLEAQIEP